MSDEQPSAAPLTGAAILAAAPRMAALRARTERAGLSLDGVWLVDPLASRLVWLVAPCGITVTLAGSTMPLAIRSQYSPARAS